MWVVAQIWETLNRKPQIKVFVYLSFKSLNIRIFVVLKRKSRCHFYFRSTIMIAENLVSLCDLNPPVELGFKFVCG